LEEIKEAIRKEIRKELKVIFEILHLLFWLSVTSKKGSKNA
jgi:hypothetical protein